jgi:ABC-2 type transport system permease protein
MMNNTLLVIKHEILTTLHKRSFWLMTILFPGFILILSVGSQTVGERAIEEVEESARATPQTPGGPVIGYVDQAGIITKTPDELPPGLLQPYPSEADAQAALQSGRLRQYYLIPIDFLETGEFFLVDSQFEPLKSSASAEIFENILQNYLISQDHLGTILRNPTPKIQDHPLEPVAGPDEDDPMTYYVPFATLFIFFFTITTSSSFMLQSVAREKENRIAEVLLVSLRPRDLMLGKVIGLGAVALLQMTFWLAGGLFAMNRSEQLLQISSNFTLPTGFVAWWIAFFLLGYFTYASILGAIGALAPNAREGGQATFVVMLPLLLPLWMNAALTRDPDGPLAVGLSLFPLTAPTSMMARLAAGNVPIWQLILALLGLATTTYLVVLLAARLFRADTLLSTASFNWKRLFTELRS